MTQHFLTSSLLFAFVLVPCVLRAEDEGQGDLDKAIELKVIARKFTDWGKVIDLCDSALKKGLDEENEKFARRLLSSTLYEYASRLSTPIFDKKPARPQWLELRRQALSKLERAVQIDKQFGDAFYLLARLQALPDGDRRKALAAVGEAVRLAGDDKRRLSSALFLRSSMATTDDSKLADLNQAIIINPLNHEALTARGLYHMKKDQYEKAIEDFARVAKTDEKNLVIHHALAEAYTNLEKYDEALEHLKKAAELNPGSPLNHTLRARLLVLKGEPKKAIKDLDKALKAQPRNVGALLMRARLHQTVGNLEEAKKDIDQVLILQPGSVRGIMLRSLIAASDGKFGAAVADMERLLRASPTNVPWRLQLAAFLAADQRPSRAIKVLSTVLKDEPGNASAHRSRGDALLSIGKQTEALADYETVLKAEPGHTGVLNNLAWVLATSPDDKIRDAKRSIELGKRACELTEYKRAHILSTLAAGYAESGDFETAIKWSNKAVELGEGEVVEQLKQELESYKGKKPWRELQKIKEKPEPKTGGGDFEL
ncbi:MAG: tetratricopeptide repeat protein [Planctomycetes bacterium]|nr:tetratricopeptide repeat protein [Planctomycetota bacterium]